MGERAKSLSPPRPKTTTSAFISGISRCHISRTFSIVGDRSAQREHNKDVASDVSDSVQVVAVALGLVLICRFTLAQGGRTRNRRRLGAVSCGLLLCKSAEAPQSSDIPQALQKPSARSAPHTALKQTARKRSPKLLAQTRHHLAPVLQTTSATTRLAGPPLFFLSCLRACLPDDCMRACDAKSVPVVDICADLAS